MTEQRTEKEVLTELSQEARSLLKRVLEIEREKLHITGATTSLVEEILKEVEAVHP